MDCEEMNIKVEIRDESYYKGSAGSTGHLNSLSVKVEHEEEQKPVSFTECSIASATTEKDTKHLLAISDQNMKCEEIPDKISELGSSHDIKPAYSGNFTEVGDIKQGESVANEDILKVESSSLNVSKEEVCSFLEESGYENVKVFSSGTEVTPKIDVSFLRAKKLKQFCDPTSVEGMYKCVFCEFVTPFIYPLKQHVSVKHRDSFKYSCAKCGKDFLSKVHLYHHNRNLHFLSDKPVSCPKCDHTSTSYRDHLEHQKLMHRPKKKCSLCNYVTLSKPCLQRHMKNKHSTNVLLPHKCHTCMKRFPSMSVLESHQRTHSGNRPFKCTLCDHRCSANSSLKIHFLRKHLKNSGYWCRLCRMKFDTESELSHHKAKHTLRCRFCDFLFTQHYKLRIHEKNQHINRKCYKCRYCNKKFNTDKEKIEHEQPSESNSSVKCKKLPPSEKADPHTALIIICDDCNEQFPNKKVLKKHRKYCVFA